MIAIVQAQDVDIAEESLKEININYYELPSVGGFLGRKNATLIIHSPDALKEKVLEKICRSGIWSYI